MLDFGEFEPPVMFVPATKHYSWPKAAALTGVGGSNCCSIKLDVRARMDMEGGILGGLWVAKNLKI